MGGFDSFLSRLHPSLSPQSPAEHALSSPNQAEKAAPNAYTGPSPFGGRGEDAHDGATFAPPPAPIDVDALVKDLTPPQKQAVLHTEGPLLVLAAAGSGKTRVITRRIAYLVAQGVPPWSIMALTFTNKAAGEMRERVQALLGGPHQEGAPPSRLARGLTVTTFHSLCARLLRRYAESAGLKPDFTIYDSGDQSTLCKKVIESLQLSTSNFPPRSVLSAISNAKNDLLDAEAFAARALDFSSKTVAKVYLGYTRALRAANAVDFDDLLLLTAKILDKDPLARAECQKRWQYLLVDEYQDTNHAQFLIASLIAGDGPAGGKGPNFCVVGDPDQAIYGWRGADISNILDFERHYPKSATITLGENFRSAAPILAAADTLIRNNKRRKHKDLFTSKKGGDKPQAVLCRNERHEADLIVDWFRTLHDEPEKGRQPLAWRDMAVFYRTNALSRVIEDALRQAGVPYSIARGTAYYEREEVKSAVAYLRVVANQADGVSLARIVNVPARGIGDKSLDMVEEVAERSGVTLFAALENACSVPGLSTRATTAIGKFVGLIYDWTGNGSFMGAKVPTSLAELVDRVVKESGLESMYKAQAAASQNEADAERLDNLAELVSSARAFEQEFDASSDPAADLDSVRAGGTTPPLLAMLRAYLESIALVADADAVDPSQGSITLMTLHAAKGLEFPAVAMLGLEEGLLPHTRAIMGEGDDEMEEERRLCFVGITRAMRKLMMTAAKYRTIRGMEERTIPSRFLSEIPADHLQISDQSDIAGGLGGGYEDDQHADDIDQRPVHSEVEYKPGAPGAPGRTPVVGSRARSSTPSPGYSGEFPVGCTVRHPQFGTGVVEQVTLGANARAVIVFKDVGKKTLVLEYARLTRVK